MSLKTWAIKPGELRGLERDALLRLMTRFCERVAPWAPPGPLFQKELKRLQRGDGTDLRARVRALADAGAMACNRLEATDEPKGRCLNYAASTLSTALECLALPMGAPLKKQVILCAKLAASIPAVLAHAHEPSRVDERCVEFWELLRSDVRDLQSRSTVGEP